MIAALGTKNPAKVDGVRKALGRFFPEFDLRTVDSAPVAKAQPFGLEQISEGAIARANYALSKAGGDMGIGVEAGIFKMGDSYFNHQQAAIADGKGRVSLGHSAGFPLPTVAVEKLLQEGGELESFAINLTGIEAVGDKGGVIAHLTSGAISRTDLTEQCVITALIPWMHKPIYGF